jgi:hypothetical protein
LRCQSTNWAHKDALLNLKVRTSDDAARVVDAYLGRWGVEEANQFVKQGFDLENVRALTWTGLRRMVQLVYLAYGFLAALVHGLRQQVERIAATSTTGCWRVSAEFYDTPWSGP